MPQYRRVNEGGPLQTSKVACAVGPLSGRNRSCMLDRCICIIIAVLVLLGCIGAPGTLLGAIFYIHILHYYYYYYCAKVAGNRSCNTHGATLETNMHLGHSVLDLLRRYHRSIPEKKECPSQTRGEFYRASETSR